MDFLRAQEEKQKRVRDAQEMYQSVLRNCEKSNTAVPPYDFYELIGKGAFGRVYKCRSQATGNLVAVKITNIDEEDFHADFDRMDETIRDFKKEVSILQQLKDSKTRNVNIIHDAFDLHSQLWIVADYCTGGSVRTLMRPFQREKIGLEEKYIIPIARELIIALKGMHEIGIIHRDVKCANVYITEDGDIQLGDFGIVGVLEDSASSKRKTIVGTPHWMPKEIVDVMTGVATEEKPYGTEIDIWSYGCTLYEMATGAPPNSDVGLNRDLADRLEAAPRLEGDSFSNELKDLVAFCLNPNQQSRPSADAVLRHPYIAATSKRYPTSNLVRLIENFKVWEHGGGSRSSLWLANPTDFGYSDIDDDDSEDDSRSSGGWNFSTSESFDEKFSKRLSNIYDAPADDASTNAGPTLELPPIKTHNLNIAERIKREHAELSANRGEKSLDRLFKTGDYQLHTPVSLTPSIRTPVEAPTPSQSDLPLRTYTNDAPMRESMIDLDEINIDMTGFHPGALSNSSTYDFANDLTVKGPSRDTDDDDDDYVYGQHNDKRATMDWAFPSEQSKRDTMGWTFATAGPAPPRLDEPNISMELPPLGSEGQLPAGFRPTLDRTATEPVGHFRGFSITTPHGGVASASRVDDYRGSMIDLDAALGPVSSSVPVSPERPSTSNSQFGPAVSTEHQKHPLDMETEASQGGHNRFSYHKQWSSEGGQHERLSRTGGQMAMHARGSSLTSTESGHDQPLRRSAEKFPPMFSDHDPIGMGLDGRYAGSEKPGNEWPDFDQFGTTPRLGDSPTVGDFAFPSSASSQRDTMGKDWSLFQRPDRAMMQLPHLQFPQIMPPQLSAMMENCSDQVLEDELGRQMDILGDSLSVLAKVLALHGNVDESVDESDHRLSDLDVGFESTQEGPEDSEGSSTEFNAITARRTLRKLEMRSPPLPRTAD